MSWLRRSRRVIGAVAGWVLLSRTLVGAPLSRVRFPDSVAPVAQVTRNVLTTSERAQTLDLVVSLRVRDFAGLQALVHAGKRLSRGDLDSRFLPAQTDYDRVAAWLGGEGLAVTIKDPFHTMLFVRGTVDQIAAAFDVSFARVSTADGEFTSAVAAPAIPADLAPTVLGVMGLQPHLRFHPPARVQATVTNFMGIVTPADIRTAYNVPDSLDGTGQTICVIMASTPQTSDLTTFWQDCGSTETLSNFTVVPVNGGPTAASQTAYYDEGALDSEWASGMAPGAQVRFYAVPDLTLTQALYACVQIVGDVGPSVISYSAAGPETQYPAGYLTASTQAFALLAGNGYCFVCSSGDSGSNPNPDSSQPNVYGANNPASVEYPASDPNATGVGGTTMTLGFDWSDQGETTWAQIGTSPALASGGGVSGYFPRPAWQAGVGVPPGAMRCVPDVSAIASVDPLAGGYTGGFSVFNGTTGGQVGTSLSAQIVAALVALINQSRASQGQTAIGLLGPQIYPLIGSSAVNDISTGNNGAYNAGTGYDLCTGIGTLNIGNLVTLLSSGVSTVPPPTGPVKAGAAVSMSFTSTLSGNVQWRLEGQDIVGATGLTYSISAAGAADNGEYSVVISGGSEGTFTYDVGPLLTVSDARIVNLSARADVQTGTDILIAGFVVSGTGTKSMLVRGIGPALEQFGLSGFLAAPVLTLFDSNNSVVAANSGWDGDATLVAAMASLGAFALDAGSLDDVLLQSVPVGSYTAQVAGNSLSTGVALAELYDNDFGISTSRLINISSRAYVQSGSNILIAGFVIGSGPTGADETVLVRGIGPALTGFGVTGALQNPVLTLLDSKGNVIATNQGGWTSLSTLGSSPVKANVEVSTFATMSAVGAFSLANNALDAAMTVTLPPGSYTAQVSGAGSTSGVGLVEVYEVR